MAQGYFVQVSNPRAKHGPFPSMKKARAFAQRLADKIGKSVKIIIGGGGHTGVKRRKNSSAKSRIPGFDAWDTFGGGTGAPEGTYSYSFTAPSGKTYRVSPHSPDGTKRRLRYVLTVSPGAYGLHGWIALDGSESGHGHGASPRNEREALKAIRAHDAKSHHEISRTNPAETTFKHLPMNVAFWFEGGPFLSNRPMGPYYRTGPRTYRDDSGGTFRVGSTKAGVFTSSEQAAFDEHEERVAPGLRGQIEATKRGHAARNAALDILKASKAPLMSLSTFMGKMKAAGFLNESGDALNRLEAEGLVDRITPHKVGWTWHPKGRRMGGAKLNPIYGPGRKGGSFSIATIKGLNKAAGGHWFEAGAMRFFGTKVLPTVYDGPGGVFFVASNKMPDSDMPRFWYVAQFNPETAGVSSLDTMQAMDHVQTKAQAVAKAKLYAQGTGGMVNNPVLAVTNPRTKYATPEQDAEITRLLEKMTPNLDAMRDLNDGGGYWGAAKDAITWLVVNDAWMVAESVASGVARLDTSIYVDDRVGGSAASSGWTTRVTRGEAIKGIKALRHGIAKLSTKSNPVLAVTNPVTPTVDGFLLILTGALTQYDSKQQRKGQGSPYALGHYMGAVQKIKADMAGRLFSSDPADLRKLKTSMNFHLISDFSPVKSTTKKIDDYLATGKLPKYPIDRDRPRENPYRIVGSRIPADIARREDLTQAQAIRFSHDWQPGADDMGNQIQYSPDGRPPWTANASLDAIARSDTPESTAKWLGFKLQRSNPTSRWGHSFKKGTLVTRSGHGGKPWGRYIKLAPASDFTRAYGPQAFVTNNGTAPITKAQAGVKAIGEAALHGVSVIGLSDLIPVEETKSNPHTGAFRKGGVWPLTPSTHFKGETSLACPRCGGKDITMRAVYGPGGRLGDPGGGERIDCGTCGFSQYEPERDRPPALGSVEWYQAQGSKKNPRPPVTGPYTVEVVDTLNDRYVQRLRGGDTLATARVPFKKMVAQYGSRGDQYTIHIVGEYMGQPSVVETHQTKFRDGPSPPKFSGGRRKGQKRANGILWERSWDMGNNESQGYSLGTYNDGLGTTKYMALTPSQSKRFKTQAGAVRWLMDRLSSDEDRAALAAATGKRSNSAERLVTLWALPRGSSDRMDEQPLTSFPITDAQAERVEAAASKDGWHSFRRAEETGGVPDFAAGLRGKKRRANKGTRKAGAYASFVKSQMPRFRHLPPKQRMSAIAAEWRSKKAMN